MTNDGIGSSRVTLDDLLSDLRFSPAPAPSSQQRGLETRSKIVSAAIAIFSDKGFEAASTHMIARAAGVNQGLITYYFGSKLQLWKEAVDQTVGNFRNTLAHEISNLAGHDRRTFVGSILRHYIVWFSKNSETVRLLNDANRKKTDRLEWYAERHIRFIHPIMKEIIAMGQRDGIIIDGPVDNIYYSIISSSQVFNITTEVEIITGIASEDQKFVEDHVDLLCRMVMRDR